MIDFGMPLPVRHCGLKDVCEVRVATDLCHQGCRNASRFPLMLEEVLFKVTGVIVVAVANVASIE